VRLNAPPGGGRHGCLQRCTLDRLGEKLNAPVC
jgi:hypothetical protein